MAAEFISQSLAEFISKVHNLKQIFWSILQELSMCNTESTTCSIKIVLEQLETDFNLFNK